MALFDFAGLTAALHALTVELRRYNDARVPPVRPRASQSATVISTDTARIALRSHLEDEAKRRGLPRAAARKRAKELMAAAEKFGG